MSVIAADREPWKGRSANYQMNVGGDQKASINRTIVDTWLVETDNKYDDAVIVLASNLVPEPLSPHPNFPLCLLTQGSANQNGENPKLWHCSFTYTSLQPRTNDDNPLNRPDVVSWSSVPTKKVIYSAIRGQIVTAGGTVIDSSTTENPIPITNSALDKFQTALEDDDFDRSCTITRNVSYVPDWVEDLELCVNDSVVMLGGLSCDVATLRFMPVDIGPLSRENDVYFYPITIKLHRRKSGWDWRLPDQGTSSYSTLGNPFTGAGLGQTKQQCLYNGIPVTSPVNLDGGQAAGSFGMGAQNFSADPTKQVFITYQRTRGDFTQLRLPPR